MIFNTIENLLYFATRNLDLEYLDKVYVRNHIYHILKIDDPMRPEADKEMVDTLEVPDLFVEELSTYIKENSLYEDSQVESVITEIMGLVAPRPSKVENTFNELKKNSPKEATEYLYKTSVMDYYVQKTKVDKNILWESKDKLEISINLSKPEKSNKDIKAALTNNSAPSYPKCVLCEDNLGFAGKGKFVPRQNIRIIPLNLNNHEWFLQFSPYGYYNRHCIVIKKEHEQMCVCKENLLAMFDFVDQFPHYFLGSNSDLPIVGGSILNHEHFQGGAHSMPMMKRKVVEEFIDSEYPNLRIGKVDWYNSTFIVMGKDKNEVANWVLKLVDHWYKYDDEVCDIVSSTNNERHNAITPTLLKKDGVYYMYIILRNNRCNEQYPEGIFHAHPEYHHIKKEGIGLIEAMGLFILPARLVRQLDTVETIVKNNTEEDIYLKLYPDMKDFVPMINKIKAHHSDDIKKDVIGEVDEVCKGILENTAVFKSDELGKKHFRQFAYSMGLKDR